MSDIVLTLKPWRHQHDCPCLHT